MKFRKWKKEIKAVHKEHVKNMIIVNNPKINDNKKSRAFIKLKELENKEKSLEKYKNKIKAKFDFDRFDGAGNDLYKMNVSKYPNVNSGYIYKKVK